MPLHIVIDARRVRDFGIGTYIRNIARSLSLLDAENQYTLIAHPDDAAELAGLGPNFRIAPFGMGDRGLKHNFSFPGFLRSLKASLYHIPLNSVAWAMPRPYVVTIHDLSSLLFPQRRDFRFTLHQQRYRRGVVRAARVIAVSNATRRDLEAILHLSSDRLSTIYSAPDPAFTSVRDDPAQQRQILDRYSITYPYILYAGTVRVHKNVPRLVEAFAVLRHKLENHPVYKDLRLVIIGDELSKNPAVRRAVAHSRIENSVRFLGFVPIETLRVFYCAAEAFAFPTLYEGFGLAPLEAMACGAPVIASRIASISEVCGKAARLVQPTSVDSLTQAVLELLNDETARMQLSYAGQRRAADLTWDRTARLTRAVYEEAINRSLAAR